MTTQNTAPTFKLSSGKIITDFGSGSDRAYSIIQQSDGKLLAAGGTLDINSGDFHFALARYNLDGSLDNSFDGDGKLTTAFDGWGGEIKSIIQQIDGKIVAIGSSNSHFALARYNLNGTLDSAFDNDGKLTALIDSIDDDGNSLIQQNDGKIVIAGRSGSNFSMMRFNADGGIDNSFGLNGKLTTAFGENKLINYSIIMQTDGKFIAAGSAPNQNGQYNFTIARYNPNGTLDNTFGNDGKLTTDFGGHEYARSIILQTDGKFVVAGYAVFDNRQYNFAIARYNPNGTLDNTFDSDGKLTTDFSMGPYLVGHQLIEQSDGKLVLVGTGGINNSFFALARYNIDGSLDKTFNDDGKLTTSFINRSEGRSVVQQSDGKLVVAGGAGTSTIAYDFALARYNTDGSLDNTFSLPENTLSNKPIVSEQSVIVLDPYVQILDNELSALNNYNGASLTLSRHNHSNPQDTFSSKNEGTLTALNTNSDFAVDGVTIGRVSINSEGTLKLVFNSNATQSLVSKAMQQIAYANTSDVPPETVQMDWLFDDGNLGLQGTGGALSVIGSTTINITAINDTPIVSSFLPDQNLTTNVAFSYTIPNTIFTDPDLNTLSYSVKMIDGTVVPPWLSFNSITHSFSGTPSTQDTGIFDVQVTVKDTSNASTSDVFRISVLPPNSVPTGSVTITGTSTQNQTLTASNTLADADGLGVITYQWLRDGIAITNATQSNYTLTQTDVGKKISVKAGYMDAKGTAESMTSNSTALVVPIVNQAPTGSMMITGNPIQGKVLTTSGNINDADGMGTLTEQWFRDGFAVTGATDVSYTLTQADVGKSISATAYYTDGLGKLESINSNEVKIANINDAPTGSVTITGTATQNQILTANNTLADIDGLGTISYQWLSNGKEILNAIQSTYKLTQSDVGNVISVKASYTDEFGTKESVASSSTTKIENVNDTPTGNVSISGTATQNQTLTASNTLADADGLGTISYLWLREGIEIKGATKTTYTLTQADVGKTITVKASYMDALGSSESISSLATVIVADANDAPTGTIKITGTAIKGNTLTASNDLTDPDGLGTISYQWFNNGAAILDANQSAYKLTQADTGQNISVQASYVDLQNTPESVFSSKIHVASNALPTGTITIKGLATWGTTLSVTSTIKDADGLGKLSYSWQNSTGELSSSPTYTLVEDDIDTQLWLTVHYTDKKGNIEEVASKPVNVTISTKPSAVNDILIGTDKADKLSGLAGNDTLIGGLGSDRLTGGKGSDIFAFSNSDFYIKNSNGNLVFNNAIDTITDFNLREHDLLDFGDLGELTFYPTLNAAQQDMASLFYVKATGKIYLNTNDTDGFTPSAIIIISGKPAINTDMSDWNYPA